MTMSQFDRADGDSGRFSALSALNGMFSRIPHWFLALLARFAIAAVFWKSGQTKVQGFAIDFIEGQFQLGVPHFADSTIDLFRDEYKLPFLPPELAAFLATLAEHFLSAFLLIGFATRLSALGLLAMTLVIEIFVYPYAYPVHGVWAATLLYLMKFGPGPVSADALIGRWLGYRS